MFAVGLDVAVCSIKIIRYVVASALVSLCSRKETFTMELYHVDIFIRFVLSMRFRLRSQLNIEGVSVTVKKSDWND